MCQHNVHSFDRSGGKYTLKGCLAANALYPAAEFDIEYSVQGNVLTVTIEYTLADYVRNFPRFGIEFAVDKNCEHFSYVGFGPTESYSDKHVVCEYGYYESSAGDNYFHYVRPQESGSHHASKYLRIDGAFSLTANEPFSFSVNPYTTAQLSGTPHDFELEENDFVNVCIDLAMKGIGSASCGPGLPEEHEIPKHGKNTFRFVF